MRDRSQPAAHPQPAHAALSPAPIGGDAGPPRPASTMARLRAARGEQGLTTLEWLLIVAAVAGLAVVAVVIVTRVVNQTADQLASANPTVAAAQESARTLVEQAAQNARANMAGVDSDWERDFRSDCNRLRVSYGTAIDLHVAYAKGGGTLATVIEGHSLFRNNAKWTTDPAGAGNVSMSDWIEGSDGTPIPAAPAATEVVFGCFVRVPLEG